MAGLRSSHCCHPPRRSRRPTLRPCRRWALVVRGMSEALPAFNGELFLQWTTGLEYELVVVRPDVGIKHRRRGVRKCVRIGDPKTTDDLVRSERRISYDNRATV